MAVVGQRAILLAGHMDDGEDDPKDSRDINAYEYIMEEHSGRSLSVFHKRAGLGISEVDSGRTSVLAARPLVWIKAN